MSNNNDVIIEMNGDILYNVISIIDKLPISNNEANDIFKTLTISSMLQLVKYKVADASRIQNSLVQV